MVKTQRTLTDNVFILFFFFYILYNVKNIHKTDMESPEIITEGSEVRAPHITNVSRSVMTTVVALAENLCCTVVCYKLVVICNNIE